MGEHRKQNAIDYDDNQRKMVTPKPGNTMRDTLDDYRKEFPVLGFNSGKCDLNAVKFLFRIILNDE